MALARSARAGSPTSHPSRGGRPEGETAVRQLGTTAAVLHAQHTVGNHAVAGRLAAAVTVQRNPRDAERRAVDVAKRVRDAMTGDWNRAGGPWDQLNTLTPAELVAVLRNLGPAGRRGLARHPLDAARYDKRRISLALGHPLTAATVAELGAMDSIRAGLIGLISWRSCWTALGRLAPKQRIDLYRAMDRTDLKKLLGHAADAEPRQKAGLEEEINSIIAPPVSDVLLDFVPDADEIAGKSGKPPQPLGKITVFLKGKAVTSVPARGGPWASHPDPRNPGHTADPTKAGTFTLAAGKPIVTVAWQYSQLANGTPIHDTGTDVRFERNGKMVSTRTLATPLSRDDILVDSALTLLYRKLKRGEITKDEYRKRRKKITDGTDVPPLPATWVLNDFGTEGFVISGSGGDVIHTTDLTDDPTEVIKPGDLRFSHGCVHISATDRDRLIEEGFLRGGVKLTVHPYDPTKLARWGDPPD